MSWQEVSERLFFVEEKGICEIAEILSKSRKAVSQHLRRCQGYEKERERRKALNDLKRKEYKREWDREHRGELRGSMVTAETMRREHDTAALILSHEKYY